MYFCVHFTINITSLIIIVLSQYKRLLFIIIISNKLLIPRFPLHKTTFPIPIRQNFWITVRCNQRSTGSAFWSTGTYQINTVILQKIGRCPLSPRYQVFPVFKRGNTDIFKRRKGQGFGIFAIFSFINGSTPSHHNSSMKVHMQLPRTARVLTTVLLASSQRRTSWGQADMVKNSCLVEFLWRQCDNVSFFHVPCYWKRCGL